MWNGLSTSPTDTSSKINFEHKLLLLKKESDAWKIDKGFAWNNPDNYGSTSSGTAKLSDGLTTTIPTGYWKHEANPCTGYSTRKTWSGIATSDGKKREESHLLQDLQIYVEYGDGDGRNSQKAEFFGRTDGKWIESDAEYSKVTKTYSTDASNGGWKTFQTSISLGDSLKLWYEPIMEKSLSWTTCDDWSRNRKSHKGISGIDKEIMNLCYSQTTTSS